MKTIESENIRQLEDNTNYIGCAIYLEKEIDELTRCSFVHCSFRGGARINVLRNCVFENTSFSKLVYVAEIDTNWKKCVMSTVEKDENCRYHEQSGIMLVKIPGGEFLMGGGKYDDEKPVHKVTLQPFYMGKYQVTQGQWKKVMGNNPSHFKKGANHPVENVSWYDAQEFCKKTGLSLPSEAQWEYACRAGSMGEYCFGDSKSELVEYSWFNENSNDETHPVGQKKPNVFGLYDMNGNVWEWCEDSWHGDYNGVPIDGSSWIYASASRQVCRGGSFILWAELCRCALRYGFSAGFRGRDLGFRVFRLAP